MPRVINAYDGNSAIGDSLSKLGEAIYGDQAKNEVYRQKAFGQKNINDLAVDPTVGVDDPRLAKGQLAIGGTAAGTFIGQGRALANDRYTNAATNAAGERNNARTNAETHYSTDRRYDSDIATTGMNNATTLKANDQTSQRAADTQLAIDGRTLVQVDNGDGTSHYETKSNAGANHLTAPVTTEGVLGGVFRRAAANQQPGVDPFAGIDPRMMKKAGLDLPEQTLVHPQTGQTAISRDGGRTAILSDGSAIPATGFLPVGQEAALGQARDNNVRSGAAAPLVTANPATGQAATDAARTTGLGPKVGSVLNEELGAIPGGPAVIKGFTGSPQIAPGVQDARQTQDIRNQQTRAALSASAGRQTIQGQKWVDELLPQGSALANPATEAGKPAKIVNALQGDYAQLQAVATDPNTMPADRVKVTQQMREIQNVIRMWTDQPPAAGAPQAPATPQAAPAAGAPAAAAPTQTATGPGGKKIGLVNGQWVPM